jgi:pimeloyl-ACP methyl ester carboxylesterase
MNDVRHVGVGDGRHLWAERIGSQDQPTILLLAGAAMQATTWEGPFLSPLLRTGRSVIRFDWRDIGLSTWARFRDSPYTIDDLCTDALAVLDAFGVQEADLVGFSMGGCIAQLVALGCPQRVRSLALIASGYGSTIAVDRPERGRQLFDLMRQPVPDEPDKQVRRQVERWRLLCGRSFQFDPDEWERRARAWIERGQNPSCPHVRLGPQIFGVDRSERLRRMATPTHVFHGDDDPMFPLPHGRAIADSVPGATIEIYPGRGHDLVVDPEVSLAIAAGLADTAPG